MLEFNQEFSPGCGSLDNKVAVDGFEEELRSIDDEGEYANTNTVYLEFEGGRTGPYQSVGDLMGTPVAVRNEDEGYSFYILDELGEPVNDQGFGDIRFREDGLGYTRSKSSGSEFLIGGRDVEGPLNRVVEAKFVEDGFVVESEDSDLDTDLAYLVMPEKEEDVIKQLAAWEDSPYDYRESDIDTKRVTGLDRTTLPLSEHAYQIFFGNDGFDTL